MMPESQVYVLWWVSTEPLGLIGLHYGSKHGAYLYWAVPRDKAPPLGKLVQGTLIEVSYDNEGVPERVELAPAGPDGAPRHSLA